MTDDKQHRGCEYEYILKDDVHIVRYTESPRAAVLALMNHMRQIFSELREAEKDDTYIFRLLIDSRGIPVQPVQHIFSEARKLIKEDYFNCHYRVAVVMERNALIGVLQALTNGLRVHTLAMAFFRPPDYDTAYAWLCENQNSVDYPDNV